eukprot:8030849-Alexandrium_andersonii.AAC.1
MTRSTTGSHLKAKARWWSSGAVDQAAPLAKATTWGRRGEACPRKATATRWCSSSAWLSKATRHSAAQSRATWRSPCASPASFQGKAVPKVLGGGGVASSCVEVRLRAVGKALDGRLQSPRGQLRRPLPVHGAELEHPHPAPQVAELPLALRPGAHRSVARARLGPSAQPIDQLLEVPAHLGEAPKAVRENGPRHRSDVKGLVAVVAWAVAALQVQRGVP